MKSISEIFCEYKNARKQKRKESIERRAAEIFQITEYNGKLWFTFDTFLYCPCSVMQEDPILVLSALRQLYVERKTRE